MDLFRLMYWFEPEVVANSAGALECHGEQLPENPQTGGSLDPSAPRGTRLHVRGAVWPRNVGCEEPASVHIVNFSHA